MVLNGGIGFYILCKISSKISCYSHDDEIFIIKKVFFFYKFLLLPILIVIHWYEFYEKMRWMKLDKHGHQGSQAVFQPKLH